MWAYMDQESLKKFTEEYPSKYDKHLTSELDMTSLALKSHLFYNKFYEILLLYCKVPNALEGIQFSLNHKLKLAEALYGIHMYRIERLRGVCSLHLMHYTNLEMSWLKE